MRGEGTAQRGLAAHLAVTWRLVEACFEVLEPFGNHLRYDRAYYCPASKGKTFKSEESPQLVRIQSKAGRLSADIQHCVWGEDSEI